jgi:membrane protease YdiL (CAAX protease family)
MDDGALQWRLWQVPVGLAAVWGASLALRPLVSLHVGTRQVVFDAFMIAVALILAATIGQRSPRFFGLRRMTITPGRAALWIFLGALLAEFAGGVYELLFDVNGRVRIESVHPHGAQAVVLGLCGVTLVPVAEELFYRGFVHRALRTRLGLWPALVLSSSLFGLAHWVGGDDFSTVMPRVFDGLLLALLLERTGSLYPGMVAHAYFNLPLLYLFAPSLAGVALLVLAVALIVAIAVSVNDDRRKNPRLSRPSPAETAMRDQAVSTHTRASGRLGPI